MQTFNWYLLKLSTMSFGTNRIFKTGVLTDPEGKHLAVIHLSKP